MATESFEAALKFVLRWEGGFVDRPDDPGGRTNHGITQKVYDGWRARQGMSKQDVKQIADAEITNIYSEGYWSPARCDLLQGPLDLVQLDTAVNMGVRRAISFLQDSAGCSVDGNFGPDTERAIRECDRDGLLSAYCSKREAFYRQLVVKKPALAVFLKGWLNRLNALRAEVGLPAGASRSFGDVDYTARIPDLGEDAEYDE